MGKNIIELNGKRYDALTGSLLGESETPLAHTAAGSPAGHRGRFIDGIIVKSPKPVSTKPTQAPAFIPVKSAPVHAKYGPSHVHVHHAAKHLPAHKPEHAKTLMRSVVLKPAVRKKPLIKTQAPAEVMAAPIATIVPKMSVNQINPERLERSHDVQKSAAVKKFSPVRRPIAPARAAVMTPLRARSAAVNRAQLAAAAPRPAAAPAKPDIFEAAIARAKSHEQPRPVTAVSKKRRHHRRLINIMAGLAAVLVIAGFIGYLNAPNIEVRLASLQAGFHASLPSYQPVGYAMSRSVSSHNSQVTVSFHSDNGTSFKLTQQASNWDSSTLYDNLIAATNAQHQTIQSNGRTIYLFGNSRAAWVNSGVLYQIGGNAELSNDQISQLAASM